MLSLSEPFDSTASASPSHQPDGSASDGIAVPGKAGLIKAD
jgi:hypothetical protein